MSIVVPFIYSEVPLLYIQVILLERVIPENTLLCEGMIGSYPNG